jgi:hypothetical protein
VTQAFLLSLLVAGVAVAVFLWNRYDDRRMAFKLAMWAEAERLGRPFVPGDVLMVGLEWYVYWVDVTWKRIAPKGGEA